MLTIFLLFCIVLICKMNLGADRGHYDNLVEVYLVYAKFICFGLSKVICSKLLASNSAKFWKERKLSLLVFTFFLFPEVIDYPV